MIATSWALCSSRWSTRSMPAALADRLGRLVLLGLVVDLLVRRVRPARLARLAPLVVRRARKARKVSLVRLATPARLVSASLARKARLVRPARARVRLDQPVRLELLVSRRLARRVLVVALRARLVRLVPRVRLALLVLPAQRATPARLARTSLSLSRRLPTRTLAGRSGTTRVC